MSTQTFISALLAGTLPSGVEVAPFDQSGTTVKLTQQQIRAWPLIGAEIGFTVAQPQFNYADVRRYGAQGLGEDDTAFINAALTVGAATGIEVNLGGISLLSSGGHVHDISKCTVHGHGATITFSTMASSGTGWTTTCTAGGVSHDAQHQRYTFRDVFMLGTGVGTCWYLNANAEPAVANVAFYNICVENFSTGQLWGNNCYIIQHFGCIFNLNNTGIYMPGGLSNTGESIHYYGGAITNGNGGINIQGAGATVRLFGVSIDANTTYISYGNGCILELNGCHIEFNNAATLSAEPIQGNAHLNIIGGCIIADGSGPFSYPAVFNNSGLVRISGGCFFNNLQNTANLLNSGSGQILIEPGSDSYSLTALPLNVGTLGSPSNLMFDGGFAQATILDNIGINADTATITSRLTGTNISLAISSAAHRSGSQCLAATKVGAAATQAGFIIAVDATPGQLIGGTYWLAADASYGQTLFTGGYWARIVTGTGGSVQILNSSSVGVQSITSLSTSFQQIYVPRTRAPTWANAFFLAFNMTSMPAMALYVDDVNLSAM